MSDNSIDTFILSESIINEAMVLTGQRPQVRFSAFPRIYFDAAKIYRWRWLEKVDRGLKMLIRPM